MSSTTFYGSQNLVGIGSVGIGTTSPSYALDVNGFIRTTYPLIADTTATGSNYSAFRITAGGDGQCYIQAGSSLTSAATANVLFTGINGGPERMRINLTSGNVGIGTTNPGQMLHVTANAFINSTWIGSSNTTGGSGCISLFQGFNMLDASNNYPYYGLGCSSINGVVNLQGYSGVYIGDSANQGVLSVWNAGVGIGTYARYTQRGLPPTNGLIVSGNVGIGTANPATALDVFTGTMNAATVVSVNVSVQALYGTSNTSTSAYVPQDFSSSGLNIPAYVVSNTATTANTVQYSSLGPFAGEGSLYFPGGTGAYVNFGTASASGFWPGGLTSFSDGTIEFWTYISAYPTGSQGVFFSRSSAAASSWNFAVNSTGTLYFNYSNTVPVTTTIAGGTVSLNTWTHLALTIKSSTISLFINGGTPTTASYVAGTIAGSGSLWINNLASVTPTGLNNNAYIACARITQGQALYTTTFTPPTGPLQPIQGTTQAGLPYGTVLLLRNAPAPGRIQTTKFSGANSGSVLSFPPAAMTGYSSVLNAGYGQGVYVASASVERTGAAWNVFNKNYAGTNLWQVNPFPTTTNTVDVNGNVYNGEWDQLQMPVSIVLSNYIVTASSGNQPSAWTILGSRDGINWNLVDSRTYNIPSTSNVTFQVSSSQAFSYFRYVYQASQGTYPALGQLVLNGSIESVNVTPDGRLGVGVTNPARALEVAGDVVCAGTLSAGNPLMFRNRIINGDMRIAQRGTSVTAQGGTGAPYLVDRWAIEAAITTGQFAYYQNVLSVSDTPYQQGFRYASNIVVTTALTNYYSCTPRQSIENQNVSDLMWGTPFGVPVTVSLWIKTSAAAGSVIPVSIRWSPNAGANFYVYPFNSVGAGPGIWQYISFTVPPPPTTYGAAPNDANNLFNVYLGNGYQGTPAVAGTWTNTSQLGSSTQTNTYGTSGTYFTWTGVQLEKGTVATPFEVRPYGVELALCQRYYEVLNFATLVSGAAMNTIVSSNPGSWDISYPFKVQKRANPTMTNNSGVSLSSGMTISGTVNANTNEVRLGLTTTTGWQQIGTTGMYISYWGWNPAGNITANAEL